MQSGLINQFPFDPVGMNSPDMAVKEVKNGRLAMIAFVGFCVQALVTREGPIEGLVAHISNPFGHNITTNILNMPQVIGK
jgi:light-harvesting complex I chlorophyll a/b binding protein 5